MKKVVFPALCISILLLVSCDSPESSTTSRPSFSRLGTVTWFSPWDDMQPSKRRTKTVQALENKLGVKFRMLGIDPSGKYSWSGSFRPELTQDEMPDIYTTYASAIDDTTIAASAPFTLEELSQYMPSYTKELMRYYDEIGVSFTGMMEHFTHDGMLYHIPRILPHIMHPGGILWRKDILDELGLPAPVTLEEWEHVFEKYKEAYPDSYAGTFREGLYWIGHLLIYAAYGGMRTTTVEFIDDRIQPTTFRPEFADALETIRRWYEKGYIRPCTAAEVRENKKPATMFVEGEILFANLIGAYLGNWICEEPYYPDSMQERCRKLNPDAEFVLGSYPVVDDSIRPAMEFPRADTTFIIGFGAQLAADRDRLHDVMQLLDTMGSDTDIFVTAHAGIEGTDWAWKTTGDGRRYVAQIVDGEPPWNLFFNQYHTYWGLTSTLENRELLYDPRILASIRQYTEAPNAIYGGDNLRMVHPPYTVPAWVDGSDNYHSMWSQLIHKMNEESTHYIVTGNGTAQDVYDYQKTLWNAPYARELLQKATEWYLNGEFY